MWANKPTAVIRPPPASSAPRRRQTRCDPQRFLNASRSGAPRAPIRTTRRPHRRRGSRHGAGDGVASCAPACTSSLTSRRSRADGGSSALSSGSFAQPGDRARMRARYCHSDHGTGQTRGATAPPITSRSLERPPGSPGAGQRSPSGDPHVESGERSGQGGCRCPGRSSARAVPVLRLDVARGRTGVPAETPPSESATATSPPGTGSSSRAAGVERREVDERTAELGDGAGRVHGAPCGVGIADRS